MTKSETAERITKYIYDSIINADCSCSYDSYGTCWYHMNDEERIEMMALTVERMIDDISS